MAPEYQAGGKSCAESDEVGGDAMKWWRDGAGYSWVDVAYVCLRAAIRETSTDSSIGGHHGPYLPGNARQMAFCILTLALPAA